MPIAAIQREYTGRVARMLNALSGPRGDVASRGQTRFKTMTTMLILACGVSPSATVATAQADAPLQIHIVDMSFAAALAALGPELNVKFTGERSERRRVTDLRLTGTSQEMVATLMRSVGMDAFEFNGNIYFSPIEERAVRLIPIEKHTVEQARNALDAAGLVFPDFDISEVANGGALVMSGPVRYLALSEGVINTLRPESDDASDPVRIRRGGIIALENATPVVSDVSLTNSDE